MKKASNTKFLNRKFDSRSSMKKVERSFQKQSQWLGNGFELTSSALWSKSPWLGNGLGFTAARKRVPRRNESDSTARNCAEGRAGDLEIAKKPRVFEG